MSYLFAPPDTVSLAVAGTTDRFPVARVFCVGRNYVAHVREMGGEPERQPPCYFTKSALSVVPSGSAVPYPPGTDNLHHEIELVVAIGAPGFELTERDGLSVVYGYACGLDMTRRDLQLASRESRGPWDLGKDFESGAVVGAIAPAEHIGHPSRGRIYLSVNGETRQDSDIANLIWSVPEILADLSRYYHLRAGDLVFTGTPDGVGPVCRGDRLSGGVDGVGEIDFAIAGG